MGEEEGGGEVGNYFFAQLLLPTRLIYILCFVAETMCSYFSSLQRQYAIEATVVPATEVPPTEVPPAEVHLPECKFDFQADIPGKVPATEITVTEVPAAEVPAAEVPASEGSTTEIPVTKVLSTQAPNSKRNWFTFNQPATEVPATKVPAAGVTYSASLSLPLVCNLLRVPCSSHQNLLPPGSSQHDPNDNRFWPPSTCQSS